MKQKILIIEDDFTIQTQLKTFWPEMVIKLPVSRIFQR